jgi:hypothetical protein
MTGRGGGMGSSGRQRLGDRAVHSDRLARLLGIGLPNASSPHGHGKNRLTSFAPFGKFLDFRYDYRGVGIEAEILAKGAGDPFNLRISVCLVPGVRSEPFSLADVF